MNAISSVLSAFHITVGIVFASRGQNETVALDPIGLNAPLRPYFAYEARYRSEAEDSNIRNIVDDSLSRVVAAPR